MARNREYTRWRPIALQVVLCLILAAVTGTAAVYSRNQLARQNLELGLPIRYGLLDVRIPQGWTKVIGENPPHALLLEDNRTRMKGSGRRIRITQIPVVTPGSVDPRSHLLGVLKLEVESSQRFDFLGQTGVLMVVPYPMLADIEGLEQINADSEPGIYASVILSNGEAVTVSLLGPTAFEPSSEKILRQFVDGLSLGGSKEMI